MVIYYILVGIQNRLCAKNLLHMSDYFKPELKYPVMTILTTRFRSILNNVETFI